MRVGETVYKTNPNLFLKSASSDAPTDEYDTPSRTMSPRVGVFRAPNRFGRVVLPESDGPTTAIKSPSSAVKLTPPESDVVSCLGPVNLPKVCNFQHS